MYLIITVTVVAPAIALAIVLILAARKPDTFRIQRAAGVRREQSSP